MLVVSRFRVPSGEQERFRPALEQAHAALAVRPGYASGQVGRNVDDPDLWVLVTTWADVGSYRRALSSYDVKLALAEVMAHAVDEPSAYESVEPGTETNESHPRTLG
ncbi:MAG TPA: antibiotic biosynthesis monooxygenase family protein [Nocardioidaceae bacterium]|nr:antibiotic biosynthesis monooxygenase family protein [Nocardioidaceae bacterium]